MGEVEFHEVDFFGERPFLACVDDPALAMEGEGVNVILDALELPMPPIEVSQPNVQPREKPYVCDKCSKGFIAKGNLDRHVRIHHMGGVLLKCPDCDFTCQYECLMERHPCSHGKVSYKTNTCFQCDIIFPTSIKLYDHLSKNHPEMLPFTCDQCPKRFASEERVKLHVNRSHVRQESKCELCGKVYANQYNLKAHMNKCH